MVDPVTLTTIGVLVGPIVGDLVQDALKDYVKDFFKDGVKNVETLAQKPFAQNAVKRALTAFSSLFLQQLAECGLNEKQLQTFVKPLQQFVKEKTVRQSLGTAFSANCQQVDAAKLRECWQTTVRYGKKPDWKQIGTPKWWKDKFPDAFYGKLLPAVPAEFDWQKLGEDYRQAVREIVRQDEELRAIFDSQNQERTADAVERLAGVPKDFDLLAYREGLREQYNHLDFGSLDAQAGNYERTLTLQEIFLPQKARECQEYMPQVHELPVEVRLQMRERGDLSAEELEAEQLERVRRAYSQQSPKSILEIVEDSRYRYLVVLGDPGAGKSTLLKYLALQWAKLETQALTSQPVPLLVELRKYVQSKAQGECRDFLEFMNGASTWIGHLPQNILHEWLKAGRCVALFDGLDEVFDPQLRTQVIAQIHNFTQTYADVKVVVTSRVIGYQPQKLKNAQFHHFMLEEFDEEQIDEFVRRWHELTFTDRLKKAAKLERLQKELAQRRTIRELAGNPLLLTMIAILNRNQELPRNRVKLYQEASKVLLHKWDVDEKQLKPGEDFDTYFIDEEVKQAICRQIAYRMQSGEKGLRGNVIEKEALRESIAEALAGLVGEKAPTYAKSMVEQLRERNFILCYLGGNHEDYYAFVHRTFLEYFCAWAFVWQFEKERSIDLAYLKTEVFGKHWRDESWHKVLRLIAGMLDGKLAGEMIEFLLEEEGKQENFVNVFLAAECLDEVKNRNAIAQIDRRLQERVQSLTRYGLILSLIVLMNSAYIQQENNRIRKIRTKAVATFAEVWHENPDTLPWLKRATSDEDWAVRRAAVKALATGWKDHPDTLPWLKRATSDEKDYVRSAAVSALATGWKDHPDTLPLLKKATSDEHWAVQQAALQALATGWKDHPDTLPWLKKATSDKNSYVRGVAVKALATGWKDHPDTLPLLKKATSDEHSDVRRAAVSALTTGWKDHPDTLPLLKKATSDKNSYVRRAAVEAIVTGWKDHPDTLPWLKKAASDKNSYVQQVALQALATVWKDHPDTLPLLKKATSYASGGVRYAALQAISTVGKDDPNTLPLLKKATSDADVIMRQTAVEAIVTGWKDHPDTLPLLKRATSDEDIFVQQVALQALTTGWKDHPDTLPWLKKAASDANIFVQQAAVSAIVSGWKYDPETLPWLKKATSGGDSAVRQAAVSAIASGWKDDPDTLPLLKKAISDADFFVRQVAVMAIATGWKDDPETLLWLKKAISDGNWVMQKAAVEAIATGWKDDPETLPLLKNATSDAELVVRYAAVEAIATRWKDDPETLPLLKNAIRDENEYVRRVAVEAIASGWKDDPQTLPLLKSATSDEHPAVRRAAVSAIASGWKDDPETLPLLKSATSDEDSDVRQAAVEAISTGWKDEPGIFELLSQIALNDPFVRENDWQDNPRKTALVSILNNYADCPADTLRERPEVVEILRDRSINDSDEQLRQFAQKKLAEWEGR